MNPAKRLFRFPYLQIIRLPNLIIVAITQLFLQYLVLVPELREAGLSVVLPKGQFLLLVLDTMLVAAGGYVVNDILDEENDQLNKPDRVFVGAILSRKSAWFFYWALTIIGFAIAWYLAVYVGEIHLLGLYPLAVTLLFLYSRHFKRMPLVGNVVVALFCAFVPGLVLFAERPNYDTLGAVGKESQVLFWGYLVFAFLSTLLREMVKDVEDLEGDSALGLRTLPIKYGVGATKNWIFGTGAALFAAVVLFAWWLAEKQAWTWLAGVIVLVIAPLGYVIWLVKLAVDKPDFTYTSKWTKLLMLGGLALLFICKIL